jgi:hypothetical protein
MKQMRFLILRTVVLGILLASAPMANAFYNPSQGRWLNRDPADEQGGANLYSSCGNAQLTRWDLLGLWEVDRHGLPRATARPAAGETIRQLAAKIRLNPDQYRKWLVAEWVTTKPFELDTPLDPCDRFSVPNTAFVDASDYTLGWIRFWMNSYRLRLQSRWRSSGYFVRYSYYSVDKPLILAHFADPDMYAFAYFGHGSSGYLILGNDEKDWILAGRYTAFGLSEMQLIACATDYQWSTWSGNVSREGLLITVGGDFDYFNQDLQVHSGQ